MLAGRGVRLRRTVCTLLMARLVYGAERGGLKLADIAADLLGIDLPKVEQTSDWGADRLSERQIAYADVDAVVAHRVGRKLWEELDSDTRRAFRLGNATVPAVTAMRIAGVPFSRTTHEATIAAWESAYVQARDEFVAITGTEIPPAGPQRSTWLEHRMPADMLAWWPRTPGGQLRVRSADLERLAAIPEIRPLLEVIWTPQKRLSAFGHGLLEKVGARTAASAWTSSRVRPRAVAVLAASRTCNSCRKLFDWL
jgi:3'-5' exonuclease